MLIIFLYNLLNIIIPSNSYSEHMIRYDYQLNMGEARVLCPRVNYTCSNNKTHYLCLRKAIEPCQSYEEIRMSIGYKRRFLYGHNGLRNKIAYLWNIANMNIVHWSRDLETMAQMYLEKCTTDKDPCSTIGTNVLITNQNTYILPRLKKRWPSVIVRTWFRELGVQSKTFEQFFRGQQQGQMLNFTQMMWPNVEFMGCAMARFKEKYFAMCYYWPSFYSNRTRNIFRFGNPCTKCFRNREVCSHNFIGLCGMDLDVPNCAITLHISIDLLSQFFIYFTPFIAVIY